MEGTRRGVPGRDRSPRCRNWTRGTVRDPGAAFRTGPLRQPPTDQTLCRAPLPSQGQEARGCRSHRHSREYRRPLLPGRRHHQEGQAGRSCDRGRRLHRQRRRACHPVRIRGRRATKGGPWSREVDAGRQGECHPAARSLDPPVRPDRERIPGNREGSRLRPTRAACGWSRTRSGSTWS